MLFRSFCFAFGATTTAIAAPPPPPKTNAARGGPPRSPTPQRQYVEGQQGQDPTTATGARVLDEDVATAWGYSTGGETAPAYTRPAQQRAAQLQINPIGYYQGVSVDGGNLPPFAPQTLGTGASVLTWTGFEVKDSQSRVFFQLSTAVAPEVTNDGLTLTYRLPNTSINVRNNQRRLDTQYFKTPVTSVRIKRSGSDTVIVLRLRREVAAATRVVPASNGYSMFVIEFTEQQTVTTVP